MSANEAVASIVEAANWVRNNPWDFGRDDRQRPDPRGHTNTGLTSSEPVELPLMAANRHSHVQMLPLA
jgi:hypothetical protein